MLLFKLLFPSFRIYWLFLPEAITIMMGFAKWHFLPSYIISSTFTSWLSTVEKSLTFSFIHYLLLSFWTHGFLLYSIGYNPSLPCTYLFIYLILIFFLGWGCCNDRSWGSYLTEFILCLMDDSVVHFWYFWFHLSWLCWLG